MVVSVVVRVLADEVHMCDRTGMLLPNICSLGPFLKLAYF